jgi:hypothetical protein
LLRRRVRVSEHHRIPWDSANFGKRYEFYDQSHDSMFFLSWYQLWIASMPAFDDSLEDFKSFTQKLVPREVPQA